MDPSGTGERKRDVAKVTVPSEGGGPPKESDEPQMPRGPNPELQDEHEGMVSLNVEI